MAGVQESGRLGGSAALQLRVVLCRQPRLLFIMDWQPPPPAARSGRRWEGRGKSLWLPLNSSQVAREPFALSSAPGVARVRTGGGGGGALGYLPWRA